LKIVEVNMKLKSASLVIGGYRLLVDLWNGGYRLLVDSCSWKILFLEFKQVIVCSISILCLVKW